MQRNRRLSWPRVHDCGRSRVMPVVTNSTTLQRLTTEYIEAHDRLRLTGEDAEGRIVVLWLTQRLMGRLIPHLIGWLEHLPLQAASGDMRPSHPALAQALHETVQGFAQSAARQSHAAQPDVKVQNAQASWLVGSVDIAHQPTNVLLAFKSLEQAGVHTAQLALPEQALRQWLGVVLDQYRKADWPTVHWPAWMQTEPQANPQTTAMTLH